MLTTHRKPSHVTKHFTRPWTSLWDNVRSGWGCSRIRCWRRYESQSGTRWQVSGEHYITMSFMICTPNEILFVWSNQEEWDVRSMWHVLETGGGANRVLVGTPEGKRPLRRPRRRREDNIKICFQGVRWGGMDWIDLVQDTDNCGYL